jgi:hypothetical protein
VNGEIFAFFELISATARFLGVCAKVCASVEGSEHFMSVNEANIYLLKLSKLQSHQHRSV